MTQPHDHPADALQLLLDGRLPAEQRVAVEAHLQGCRRCQRELAALRRLKQVLEQPLAEPELPADLAGRIRSALVSQAAGSARPRALQIRRAVLAGLALAAGILLVVLLLRPGRRDLVTAAAADFTGFRSGALNLQHATAEPPALERFFARSGLGFTSRVFDFGMMGYRLTGGGVYPIAGRPSAVYLYRGPREELLLCRMYQGALAELPTGGETRTHDGIGFRIFRRGNVTLVFWEEGSMVCVLIAEGDPEAAIQLAFAKARRV
jgi:anti-sigma factor RsiW